MTKTPTAALFLSFCLLAPEAAPAVGSQGTEPAGEAPRDLAAWRAEYAELKHRRERISALAELVDLTPAERGDPVLQDFLVEQVADPDPFVRLAALPLVLAADGRERVAERLCAMRADLDEEWGRVVTGIAFNEARPSILAGTRLKGLPDTRTLQQQVVFWEAWTHTLGHLPRDAAQPVLLQLLAQPKGTLPGRAQALAACSAARFAGLELTSAVVAWLEWAEPAAEGRNAAMTACLKDHKGWEAYECALAASYLAGPEDIQSVYRALRRGLARAADAGLPDEDTPAAWGEWMRDLAAAFPPALTPPTVAVPLLGTPEPVESGGTARLERIGSVKLVSAPVLFLLTLPELGDMVRERGTLSAPALKYLGAAAGAGSPLVRRAALAELVDVPAADASVRLLVGLSSQHGQLLGFVGDAKKEAARASARALVSSSVRDRARFEETYAKMRDKLTGELAELQQDALDGLLDFSGRIVLPPAFGGDADEWKRHKRKADRARKVREKEEEERAEKKEELEEELEQLDGYADRFRDTLEALDTGPVLCAALGRQADDRSADALKDLLEVCLDSCPSSALPVARALLALGRRDGVEEAVKALRKGRRRSEKLGSIPIDRDWGEPWWELLHRDLTTFAEQRGLPPFPQDEDYRSDAYGEWFESVREELPRQLGELD